MSHLSIPNSHQEKAGLLLRLGKKSSDTVCRFREPKWELRLIAFAARVQHPPLPRIAGRSLLSAPRTDPSKPNSGTRLPPRVVDDEAIKRRRMEVSDLGEKVVDQLRDPFPGRAILLAAPL